MNDARDAIDPTQLVEAIDRLVDPARAAHRWVHEAALADLLRPGGPAAYRRGPWLVEWDGRTPTARRLAAGRFVDLGPGEAKG